MPKTRQQDHVVVLPNNQFTITYTKKWSYYSGLGLFLRCNRYPPHYFFRMLCSQETPPTSLCCRRLPQLTGITLSPDVPRQLMLKQNVSLFSKNRLQITFRWMIKRFFKLKVQYVGVVPGKMYLKCSKWPTAWQKDISWREQMCQAYTEAILCTYCVIIKEKWKPAPRYNPSQAVCLHLMGCSPRPLPNTDFALFLPSRHSRGSPWPWRMFHIYLMYPCCCASFSEHTLAVFLCLFFKLTGFWVVL